MRFAFLKTILAFGTLAQFSMGQDKSYPSAMACKVALDTGEAKAKQNRLAIQDSILHCKKAVIYIDSGTFYIDSTLIWKRWKQLDSITWGEEDENRIIIAGKSKNKTRLVLKSNVATSDSIVMLKPTDVLNGQGSAFGNGIWDMTVDIGKNNPHAIAILWRSNNWGSIQNVIVRTSATDMAGNCGIKMDMTNIGPTLFKNVRIVGFNVGIRTAQNQTGITMEHIELDSQKVTGIKNCLNSLTIRDLVSHNKVPVIQNYLCSDMGATHGGMLTLLGGDFRDGDSTVHAIENDFIGPLPAGLPPGMRYGSLFLRNIKADGYKSAIRNIPGKQFKQHVTGKNFSSGYNLTNGMPPNYPDTLPVSETPEFHDSVVSNWVHVCGGGPWSATGWSASDACFELAKDSINTTRTTLFFPPGHYFYTSKKIIPAGVKRIVGYGAKIFARDAFDTQTDYEPLFSIEGNTSNTLHIDGLELGSKYGDNNHNNKLLYFSHTSNRPVKISFSAMQDPGGGQIYRSGPNAGNLYLENIFSHGVSRWEFSKQQSVWARQLNPEGGSPDGSPKILNNGGKLWVLGLKTENFTTVLRNTVNGDSIGKAEIFGGYIFPAETTVVAPLTTPVFENLNSKLTLVYAHNKYNNKPSACQAIGCAYLTQIRDIQGNVERLIHTKEIHFSGDISRVMFYYGGPKAGLDRGGANFSTATHLLRKAD